MEIEDKASDIRRKVELVNSLIQQAFGPRFYGNINERGEKSPGSVGLIARFQRSMSEQISEKGIRGFIDYFVEDFRRNKEVVCVGRFLHGAGELEVIPEFREEAMKYAELYEKAFGVDDTEVIVRENKTDDGEFRYGFNTLFTNY